VSVPPVPCTGRETGIDVGPQGCFATSDDQVVANPRHFRNAQRRLARPVR
jgi:hypothetical protein